MVREREPTERSQRDAVDDARPFIAYLAGAQESEAAAGFQEALRCHGTERGRFPGTQGAPVEDRFLRRLPGVGPVLHRV